MRLTVRVVDRMLRLPGLRLASSIRCARSVEDCCAKSTVKRSGCSRLARARGAAGAAREMQQVKLCFVNVCAETRRSVVGDCGEDSGGGMGRVEESDGGVKHSIPTALPAPAKEESHDENNRDNDTRPTAATRMARTPAPVAPLPRRATRRRNIETHGDRRFTEHKNVAAIQDLDCDAAWPGSEGVTLICSSAPSKPCPARAPQCRRAPQARNCASAFQRRFLHQAATARARLSPRMHTEDSCSLLEMDVDVIALGIDRESLPAPSTPRKGRLGMKWGPAASHDMHAPTS